MKTATVIKLFMAIIFFEYVVLPLAMLALACYFGGWVALLAACVTYACGYNLGVA